MAWVLLSVLGFVVETSLIVVLGRRVTGDYGMDRPVRTDRLTADRS
jgi:hypothetical protein